MRWIVAVGAALAGFVGCWLGLAAARVWDTGSQVGVASVPLAVALAVLGAWAERACPDGEQDGKVPAEHASALMKRSPQGQAVGPVRLGSVGIRPKTIGLARVLVGDVPQEPAAFQPRAGLLRVLERESGPQLSVVFAVTGMRGVGKTQVAAGYARRRIADRWRLVAWIDAADTASALSGLAEVGAAAGIGSAAEDARAVAVGVRHWLEADGDRRLVVFDNVTDLDGLRPFLPAAGLAQVVITSNRRSAAGLGTGVPVDVFTKREGLAFLAKRTGLADEAGARELGTELGWLPLGLAQAAALIAREQQNYGTYLQRLRALPVADYLGRVEGDAYRHKTAEAIVLSLRGIEAGDESGRCATVMGLISVLAETGVSRGLLHAAVISGAFGQIGNGTAQVDAMIGRLAEASLVGFSGDGAAGAHRLVMRVVRERLIADGGLARITGGAVRMLRELAAGITEAWQNPAGVRELAAQVTALTDHTGRHLDGADAEVRRDLRQLQLQSLFLLNELGDSTGQAILTAEALVPTCEQDLGADHPDTLAAITNLAYAYQAAGRVAEAISLHECTLADRERVLGTDDPSTGTVRANLATALATESRKPERILIESSRSPFSSSAQSPYCSSYTAR